MYCKIIGLILFAISGLVIAKEQNTVSLDASLDFTEIKSQCYMKGQVKDEKTWLISKTTKEYYAQKFAGEQYYRACVDSFKIAKHEVTLNLYQQYANENSDIMMGDAGCYVVGNNGWENTPSANWKNPTFEQKTNHPVVCVSYHEVQKFISCLNIKLKPKVLYRLPTESEWELAARG